MVAELSLILSAHFLGCSLAKISMVAELSSEETYSDDSCSLAKISMVAELFLFHLLPFQVVA